MNQTKQTQKSSKSVGLMSKSPKIVKSGLKKRLQFPSHSPNANHTFNTATNQIHHSDLDNCPVGATTVGRPREAQHLRSSNTSPQTYALIAAITPITTPSKTISTTVQSTAIDPPTNRGDYSTVLEGGGQNSNVSIIKSRLTPLSLNLPTLRLKTVYNRQNTQSYIARNLFTFSKRSKHYIHNPINPNPHLNQHNNKRKKLQSTVPKGKGTFNGHLLEQTKASPRQMIQKLIWSLVNVNTELVVGNKLGIDNENSSMKNDLGADETSDREDKTPSYNEFFIEIGVPDFDKKSDEELTHSNHLNHKHAQKDSPNTHHNDVISSDDFVDISTTESKLNGFDGYITPEARIRAEKWKSDQENRILYDETIAQLDTVMLSTEYSSIIKFLYSDGHHKDGDISFAIEEIMRSLKDSHSIYLTLKQRLCERFGVLSDEQFPMSVLEILYYLRQHVIYHPTPEEWSKLISLGLRVGLTPFASQLVQVMYKIHTSPIRNPNQIITMRTKYGIVDTSLMNQVSGEDGDVEEVGRRKYIDARRREFLLGTGVEPGEPIDPVILSNRYKRYITKVIEQQREDSKLMNGKVQLTIDDELKIENEYLSQFDLFKKTVLNSNPFLELDSNHDLSFEKKQQFFSNNDNNDSHLFEPSLDNDNDRSTNSSPFNKTNKAQSLQDIVFHKNSPALFSPTLYYVLQQTATLSPTFAAQCLSELYPLSTHPKLPMHLVEHVIKQSMKPFLPKKAKTYSSDPTNPHADGNDENEGDDDYNDLDSIISSTGNGSGPQTSLDIPGLPPTPMPREVLYSITHILHSLHRRKQPIPASVNISALIDAATYHFDFDLSIKLFYFSLTNAYSLAFASQYFNTPDNDDGGSFGTISSCQKLLKHSLDKYPDPEFIIAEYVTNFRHLYGNPMDERFISYTTQQPRTVTSHANFLDQTHAKKSNSNGNGPAKKTKFAYTRVNGEDNDDNLFDDYRDDQNEKNGSSKNGVSNKSRKNKNTPKFPPIPPIGHLNIGLFNSFIRSAVLNNEHELALHIYERLIFNINTSLEAYDLPVVYPRAIQPVIKDGSNDSAHTNNNRDDIHNNDEIDSSRTRPTAVLNYIALRDDTSHFLDYIRSEFKPKTIQMPDTVDFKSSHASKKSSKTGKTKHSKLDLIDHLENPTEGTTAAKQQTELIIPMSILTPNSDTICVVMSALQHESRWSDIISLFFGVDQGMITNPYNNSIKSLRNTDIVHLQRFQMQQTAIHEDGLLYTAVEHAKRNVLTQWFDQNRKNMLQIDYQNNDSKNNHYNYNNLTKTGSELHELNELSKIHNLDDVLSELGIQNPKKFDSLFFSQKSTNISIHIPKSIPMLALVAEASHHLELPQLSNSIQKLTHFMISYERRQKIVHHVLGYLKHYLQLHEKKYPTRIDQNNAFREKFLELTHEYTFLSQSSIHNVVNNPVFNWVTPSLLQDMSLPQKLRLWDNESNLFPLNNNNNDQTNVNDIINVLHKSQLPSDLSNPLGVILSQLDEGYRFKKENNEGSGDNIGKYLALKSLINRVYMNSHNGVLNPHQRSIHETDSPIHSKPIVNDHQYSISEVSTLFSAQTSSSNGSTQTPLIHLPTAQSSLPAITLEQSIALNAISLHDSKARSVLARKLTQKFPHLSRSAHAPLLLTALLEYQKTQPVLAISLPNENVPHMSYSSSHDSAISSLLRDMPTLTPTIIDPTTIERRKKRVGYKDNSVDGVELPLSFGDVFTKVSARLKSYVDHGQISFTQKLSDLGKFSIESGNGDVKESIINPSTSLLFELNQEIKMREVLEQKRLKRDELFSLRFSSPTRVMEILNEESRLRYPYLPDSERGVGSGFAGSTTFTSPGQKDYRLYLDVLKKVTPKFALGQENTPLKAMYNKIVPKKVLRSLTNQYVKRHINVPTTLPYTPNDTILDMYGIIMSYFSLSVDKDQFYNGENISNLQKKLHKNNNNGNNNANISSIHSSSKYLTTLTDTFTSNFYSTATRFYAQQPAHLTPLEKNRLFLEDLSRHFPSPLLHRVLLYNISSRYLAVELSSSHHDSGVVERLKSADRVLCQHPSILSISYDLDNKNVYHADLSLNSRPSLPQLTQNVSSVVVPSPRQSDLGTGREVEETDSNNGSFGGHDNNNDTKRQDCGSNPKLHPVQKKFPLSPTPTVMILVPPTPIQDFGIPLSFHGPVSTKNALNEMNHKELRVIESDYLSDPNLAQKMLKKDAPLLPAGLPSSLRKHLLETHSFVTNIFLLRNQAYSAAIRSFADDYENGNEFGSEKRSEKGEKGDENPDESSTQKGLEMTNNTIVIASSEEFNDSNLSLIQAQLGKNDGLSQTDPMISSTGKKLKLHHYVPSIQTQTRTAKLQARNELTTVNDKDDGVAVRTGQTNGELLIKQLTTSVQKRGTLMLELITQMKIFASLFRFLVESYYQLSFAPQPPVVASTLRRNNNSGLIGQHNPNSLFLGHSPTQAIPYQTPLDGNIPDRHSFDLEIGKSILGSHSTAKDKNFQQFLSPLLQQVTKILQNNHQNQLTKTSHTHLTNHHLPTAISDALRKNSLQTMLAYPTPTKQLVLYDGNKTPLLTHAVVEKILFSRRTVHLINSILLTKLMPDIVTESSLFNALVTPLNPGQMTLLRKTIQERYSSAVPSVNSHSTNQPSALIPQPRQITDVTAYKLAKKHNFVVRLSQQERNNVLGTFVFQQINTLLQKHFQSLLTRSVGSFIPPAPKSIFAMPSLLTQNQTDESPNQTQTQTQTQTRSKSPPTPPQTFHQLLQRTILNPHANATSLLLSETAVERLNDRVGVIATDSRLNIPRFSLVYPTQSLPHDFPVQLLFDGDVGQYEAVLDQHHKVNIVTQFSKKNPKRDEMTRIEPNTVSPSSPTMLTDWLTSRYMFPHDDNDQLLINYDKDDGDDGGNGGEGNRSKKNKNLSFDEQIALRQSRKSKNLLIPLSTPTTRYGFIYNDRNKSIYTNIRVEPPVIAYPGHSLTPALDLDLAIFLSKRRYNPSSKDHYQPDPELLPKVEELDGEIDALLHDFSSSALMTLRLPKQPPIPPTATSSFLSHKPVAMYPQERTLVDYFTALCTNNLPTLGSISVVQNDNGDGTAAGSSTPQAFIDIETASSSQSAAAKPTADVLQIADPLSHHPSLATQGLHSSFIMQNSVLGTKSLLAAITNLNPLINQNLSNPEYFPILSSTIYNPHSRTLVLDSFDAHFIPNIGKRSILGENLISSTEACKDAALFVPSPTGTLQATSGTTPSLHYFHSGLLIALSNSKRDEYPPENVAKSAPVKVQSETKVRSLLDTTNIDQLNTNNNSVAQRDNPQSFAFHNLLSFYHSYHTLHVINNKSQHGALLAALDLGCPNGSSGSNDKQINYFKTPFPSDVQLATLFLTQLAPNNQSSPSDHSELLDMRTLVDSITHRVELPHKQTAQIRLPKLTKKIKSELKKIRVENGKSDDIDEYDEYSGDGEDPIDFDDIDPVQVVDNDLDEETGGVHAKSWPDTTPAGETVIVENFDNPEETGEDAIFVAHKKNVSIMTRKENRLLSLVETPPLQDLVKMVKYGLLDLNNEDIFDKIPELNIAKRLVRELNFAGEDEDQLAKIFEQIEMYDEKRSQLVKKELSMAKVLGGETGGNNSIYDIINKSKHDKNYFQNLQKNKSKLPLIFNHDAVPNLNSLSTLFDPNSNSIGSTNGTGNGASTTALCDIKAVSRNFALLLSRNNTPNVSLYDVTSFYLFLLGLEQSLLKSFSGRVGLEGSETSRQPAQTESLPPTLTPRQTHIVSLYKQTAVNITQSYYSDLILKLVHSNKGLIGRDLCHYISTELVKFGLIRGQYPSFCISPGSDGNSESSPGLNNTNKNITFAKSLQHAQLLTPQHSLFLDLHGVDFRLQPHLVTHQFEQLYNTYAIQRLTQLLDQFEHHFDTSEIYHNETSPAENQNFAFSFFQNTPTTQSLRKYKPLKLLPEEAQVASKPVETVKAVTRPPQGVSIAALSKTKDVLAQMRQQQINKSQQERNDKLQQEQLVEKSNRFLATQLNHTEMDDLLNTLGSQSFSRNIPRFNNTSTNSASQIPLTAFQSQSNSMYFLPHVTLGHALLHGVTIVTGKVAEGINHSHKPNPDSNQRNERLRPTSRVVIPTVLSQYSKALLYPTPLVSTDRTSQTKNHPRLPQAGKHYLQQEPVIKMVGNGSDIDEAKLLDGKVFYQPSTLLNWFETRFSNDFSLFSQFRYDNSPQSLSSGLNSGDKQSEVNKLPKMNKNQHIVYSSLHHLITSMHVSYNTQFEKVQLNGLNTDGFHQSQVGTKGEKIDPIINQTLSTLFSTFSKDEIINPTGEYISRDVLYNMNKRHISPTLLEAPKRGQLGTDEYKKQYDFSIILPRDSFSKDILFGNHESFGHFSLDASFSSRLSKLHSQLEPSQRLLTTSPSTQSFHKDQCIEPVKVSPSPPTLPIQTTTRSSRQRLQMPSSDATIMTEKKRDVGNDTVWDKSNQESTPSPNQPTQSILSHAESTHIDNITSTNELSSQLYLPGFPYYALQEQFSSPTGLYQLFDFYQAQDLGGDESFRMVSNHGSEVDNGNKIIDSISDDKLGEFKSMIQKFQAITDVNHGFVHVK